MYQKFTFLTQISIKSYQKSTTILFYLTNLIYICKTTHTYVSNYTYLYINLIK